MSERTPQTLVELLEISAKQHPHRPAVSMNISYRTHTFTYQKLLERAKQTANWLSQEGIGAGDVVLMNAPSSPNAVVLLFGVLLRGAIFVPLNTQSTPEMVRAVAASCEAKLLFEHSRSMHDDAPTVPTRNLDLLREFIADSAPEYEVTGSITADTLAQIMYTSGTTGEPKGVMLTHRNMLTSALAVAKNAKLGADDRFLSILPLSHIYEQVVGLFAPLSVGGRIVYLHRPSALVTLLREFQITKMAGVPEFLRILMNKIELAAERDGNKEAFEKILRINQRVPSMFLRRLLAHRVHRKLGGKLHLVASGGSPLDPELEQQWNALGVRLLQGYGLTEVSGAITMNTHTAHKAGSVGKPIGAATVTLAPDGEICLAGPSVFQGYYKRGETTAEVLKDGVFHTGDIGEIDQDGFLYIKGRKKYMLKGPGGQNIYPEDIESQLDAVPGIADSCVIGLESTDHLSIVAVVRTEEEGLDLSMLQNEVNDRLASYQRINQTLVWPEFDFPRSASKKVKRDLVQKWVSESLAGESASTGTSSASRLGKLIAGVTGSELAKMQPEARLATDLGLDSLMRVELVSRIELEFGVLIEETKITTKTTVAELQTVIDETEPSVAKEPFIRWPLSWWARPLRTYLIAPVLNFLTTLVFRVRAHNSEVLKQVPGPVLIMPNHKTAIDSVAVARSVPWHIRKDLSHAAGADSPLFLEFTRAVQLTRLWLHPFPLPTQTKARFEDGLAYVGWMLDQGCSVCIFPEGETKPDNTLYPVKDGVAFMAAYMDVPVVPVFISGIEQVMRSRGIKIESWFKTVDIWYGEALHFKPTDSLEAVRLQIAMAIGGLRDKAEEDAALDH